MCLPRFQHRACKTLHTNQRIMAHNIAWHLWIRANEKLKPEEKGWEVMVDVVICDLQSHSASLISSWINMFFLLFHSPWPKPNEANSSTAILTMKHLLYGQDLSESVRHIWHGNSHRTRWTFTAPLDAILPSLTRKGCFPVQKMKSFYFNSSKFIQQDLLHAYSGCLTPLQG